MLNTPTRQQQSSVQPAEVGFQTPPRPERPEFAEPPPVPRHSKKRRGNNIKESDSGVRHLGILFNNIALEQ